jgi:hypothetical protein
MSDIPPLFGFLLLDADSYESLKGFFRQRSFELDPATGFRLDLIDVGNPEVSAAFYELAGIAVADEDRLEVMERLATMLGVKPEERPCIVFAGAGKFEVLATFRIDPAWYSTTDALAAFGNALKDWIANLRLTGAFEGRAGLAGALESELSRLRARLRPER